MELLYYIFKQKMYIKKRIIIFKRYIYYIIHVQGTEYILDVHVNISNISILQFI